MTPVNDQLNETAGPGRTNLLHSIRGKILFVTCGSVLLTALLMGAMHYRLDSWNAEQAKLEKLSFDTASYKPLFEAAIVGMRSDAKLIAELPPIAGIVRSKNNNGVDPIDGSTTEQWKQRLETIFLAMVDARPDYYTQLRYIGVADDGRELVRINRQDGGAERVPAERLQAKFLEPYFQEALRTAPGEVYLSAVSLNREFGKIQEPYLPVIRAVAPVRDERDNIFGMVAINIAYESLLKDILKKLQSTHSLIIFDDTGDYFSYERDKKTGSFTTIQSKSEIDANPIVIEATNSSDDVGFLFTTVDGKRYVSHFRKVYFDPLNDARYLGFATRLPQSEIYDVVHKQTAYAIYLILGCAGVVCHRNSGPMNLLVSALKEELRHGEKSQTGRDHCEAA